MRQELTSIAAMHDNGMLTAEQAMQTIKTMLAPKDRVGYIKSNYTFDPLTNYVFSNKSGRRMGGTIHAGRGNSPITRDRAIWFLIAGDDPSMVGRDKTRGLYAIREEGGDRVYAAG